MSEELVRLTVELSSELALDLIRTAAERRTTVEAVALGLLESGLFEIAATDRLESEHVEIGIPAS